MPFGQAELPEIHTILPDIIGKVHLTEMPRQGNYEKYILMGQLFFHGREIYPSAHIRGFVSTYQVSATQIHAARNPHELKVEVVERLYKEMQKTIDMHLTRVIVEKHREFMVKNYYQEDLKSYLGSIL